MYQQKKKGDNKMEKETYELKEKMNEFTGKLLEEKPSIIIANEDEEFSDWVCYLFGGSIVKWRPLKKKNLIGSGDGCNICFSEIGG